MVIRKMNVWFSGLKEKLMLRIIRSRQFLSLLFICFLSFGSLAFAGQDIDKTFRQKAYSGSRDRAYTVHIPTGYNGSSAVPLVMVLHGCRQNNKTIQHDSNMDPIADQEGFIVVYPFITTYVGLRNENCWGFWFADEIHAGAGEVEDLWQIVEEVKSDYNIDANRIHITGLSSGGAMTVVFMVAHSEKVASGAPVAGIPYAETAGTVPFSCASTGIFRSDSAVAADMNTEMGAGKREVGNFIVHSNDDCTVNILSAENIRDTWGVAFNVNTSTAISTDIGTTQGTPWTHKKYEEVDGRTVVETFFLDGLDHGWYGGLSGTYSFPNAPNISQLIWDFFKDHPLNANNAPSLTISSGTSNGQCVTVSGTASDSDGSIASVTVELTGEYPQPPGDATLVGNSYDFTSCNLPNNANYIPGVTATDDGGQSVSITGSAIAVGTPPVNAAPSITIDNPVVNGTCVALSGTADDDKGVVSVEAQLGFEGWKNTILSGTDWNYQECSLAAGTYTTEARATDNEGAVTTISGISATVEILYEEVQTGNISEHVVAGRIRGYPSGLGVADATYNELFNEHGVFTPFPLYLSNGNWYADPNNIPGGTPQDNPPTIQFTDTQVSGDCVVISGNAVDDNGVDTVEVRFDGGSWQNAPLTGQDWSISRCGLSDGLHDTAVKATDTILQQTIITGPTFQIGNTNSAPNVTIDNVSSAGSCISLSGTATDDTSVSTVNVSIGGGIWEDAARSGDNWSYDQCGFADGTYTTEVQATDAQGLSSSVFGSNVTVSSGQPTTVTFEQDISNNGYVKAYCSGSGKTIGAFSYLFFGLGSDGKMNRSIVTFDTASIPDTATVTAATVRFRHDSGIAGDVYNNKGPITVDIKSGYFGSNTGVEQGDWNDTADASGVATLDDGNGTSSGTWTTDGTLNSSGLTNINLTGTTQFRVMTSVCSGTFQYNSYQKGIAGAVTLDVTYTD